jgi:HEAT repeat protein
LIAARKSLSSLRGAGVSEALLAAAQSGEAAARAEAIQALAARNATSAAGALRKLASDADAGVRTQALTALASLAQAKDVPALVDLFMQSKADADRSAAENALAALARRVTDKDAAAAPLLEALAKASAPQRPTLLRLASRVPCAKSLEVLRSGLKEADAAVQDAAVRGLVDWPDAAALPALAEIARSFADQTHRVLALRGFIRIAALQDGRTPEQRVKALAEAMPLATSAAEKKLVLAALGDFSTVAALDLATGCLSEKELEVEAATAVVNIAKGVQKTNAAAAAAARQKILDVCTSPAARQIAEGPSAALTGMVNIAPQGTASSPDGLKDDGASSGPQAAIDGDPNTYWDQEDGAKLYRLVVTFKQPEKFAAISIMGYEQHNFAPKDFEILGDGKVIKAITNAQYQDNLFVVRFDQTECKAVELKITGYYGGSPAVRELGIYRSAK